MWFSVAQLQIDVQSSFWLNLIINNGWITLGLAGIFILLVLFVLLLIIRNFLKKSNNLPSSLSMAVLLISVPKERPFKKTEDAEASPKNIMEEIGVAENIFSVLGGLRAQRGFKYWLFGRTDHFSMEIVVKSGKIYFYLAVPERLKETVSQQVHSAYPYSQIEQIEDYNIFSASGKITGAYLRFGRDFIFPIKTYRKTEGDSLNSLINALSKIDEHSGAVVQIVARSAHKRWHKKGVIVSREMQQGKPLNAALRRAGFGNIFDKSIALFAGLLTVFHSNSQDKSRQKLTSDEANYRLSPMEEEVIKGIQEKTSKAGLDSNIRLVVSSPDKRIAQAYLDSLVSAFSQFNIYEYGNGFKKAGLVNLNNLVSNFIHRGFEPKYGLLINTEEMSTLWHLPLSGSQTPNIHWLEARQAAPPFNLPDAGLLLGQNIFRGVKTPVKIKAEDRLRHMYIIGKSGTGKSVFMSNMIIQDIKNGEGLCLIDPHGDLIDGVLQHIPEERAEDVILFDPANTERPIALNMLEFTTPEQKTFVINEMINIFEKLYDLKSTGGPMFEQYMRNTMLLMMEDPASGSTLLEVPKVLADANFRRYKLAKCQNPVVRDFWEKEAEKAGGEAALANMVPYITSKLTPFVSSDLLRPIIAQQKSSFNFREAMDTGKIILIKLSKGKIGDISANLLGMVVVGKILMSALSRVEVPEAERRNFFLYIDEFQNFITESIAIILSEARKYRLSLTMAHQYIGQLSKGNDHTIREAVFGNVGTMAAFRIGPDDAEFMAKQFQPVFNQFDLINVPQYSAYVKLLIDNQNPPAFNLQTLPPVSGNQALAEKIRQLSALKYGRERSVVEQEILQRIKLAGRPIA